MAIIVETGGIIENANSYVSTTFADSYHSLRGNTAWQSAGGAKAGAMIRATQGIDTRYAGKWVGIKTNNNDLVKPQPLAWPRKADSEDTPLIDPDEIEIGINDIPLALMNAVCEVALIELTERFGAPVITRKDMIKRKKTDVLETEWFEGTPPQTMYLYIDDMLLGLAEALNKNNTDMIMNVYLTNKEKDIMDRAEDSTHYLQDQRYFL